MSANGALAALGAALAALGLVLGADTAPGSGEGVSELTTQLASGEATVDAVMLGEWIRDRRSGLALVDLRDSSRFIQYAIPTARHLRLRELVDSLPRDADIVLYDDGGGTAARAWLLLRRLGYPRVRILDRGLMGWLDGVMSPVVPADPGADSARFERVAAVSRYFGGTPRVGVPVRSEASAEGTREAVQLLTRRGCY